MRLFIAVNLPKKEKMRIHRAARPLREAGYPVRWVPPDLVHITLKFLGEILADYQESIMQSLRRVAEKTYDFELELSGFGGFPTLRRPRVIWAGVDPTPALRCLKQDLEWEFSALGFEREPRAFQPHITLGRAERDATVGQFRRLDELASEATYSAKIGVHRIDLMRSQLAASGSTYTLVESARLASRNSRR
ncbi:MAG: RNA 2',3'-cyclic phosphodiesterase [Gemmatimonadetes bacterium]|nr:RNA 2',3'-cyclic phosphodiesterase [Gemmatimonadota bacterium]